MDPHLDEHLDRPLDLLVTEADAGQRLDRFLVARAQRGGRNQVNEWLREGRVSVEGRALRKGDRVHAGQRVRVDPPRHLETVALVTLPLATLAPLLVVHEDSAFVVVDKPAGLPTHGHTLADRHTLTALLVERYPEMRSVGYRETEPGILHRLDNDTSGLLIAARTAQAFETLRDALKGNAIDKQYLALCAGPVNAPQVFEGHLVSDRSARVKVSPLSVKRSRPARTEVLQSETVGDNQLSLVTLRATHAGRHQIRAHLADAGHPLAGDRLYGGPEVEGLTRHFLHASLLSFPHPNTQEPLTFRSPLPHDLRALLAHPPVGDGGA